MFKDEERGDPITSSWWWQYKARRVADFSQSASGTYTFKVRVLEGKLDYIRPLPPCVVHEKSSSDIRDWNFQDLSYLAIS